MARWVRRVALVTGATRGIGAAITEALVRAGMTVVGVAPNVDKLESRTLDFRAAGHPGVLVPVACDVSSLEKVTELFAHIKSDPDLEGVDLCVNNAGIALAESFLTGDPKAFKTMFETNVLGSAYVAQESIKSMQERDVQDGHVIFINGLAGHRIIPGNKELHVYSSTKAAVTAMVEAVRLELRGMESRIRVSSISPGVVETDIYSRLFDGDEEKAKAFLAERKYLEANDVAEAVTYVISQPAHVQVHDILLRSTDQIP